MTTRAVDAVPAELQKHFLKSAYDKAKFWGDMFTLCNELGLRNVEARQLKAENVDLNKGIMILSDSKQVRAYITKTTNKLIDTQWLTCGRKWLRTNINDPMASVIAALPTDTKQLANLAAEYDLTEDYEKARLAHSESVREDFKAKAQKTAPKGREIDFSRNQKVKNILTKRISKYGDLCGYLFPCCELSSNRAKGNGYTPVSRQSVYNVIKSLRSKLESMSNKFKEALKGIRTGLHSFRKCFVQRVFDVMGGDILAASIAVGHGNGAGSIATTQNYLNKSQRRMDEINERLASMGAV